MINKNVVFNPNFRDGEELTSDKLNLMILDVLNKIMGGKNIRIERYPNNIIISARNPVTISATGMYIEEVLKLPAIPTAEEGPRIVHWLDSSTPGGTGNNSLWYCHPSYAAWEPLIHYPRSLSGVPVEEEEE